MPGLLTEAEIDALPIDGELISEQDLVDADGPEFGLPEGIDQVQLLDGLFKDLIRGEQAKAVLAEAEMRRVIGFSQQLDHRFVDGLGQLVARVPLSVYLHWTARYGEEFWHEADSIDFLANRAGGGRGNPGFKIKTTPKCTVVVAQKLPPAPAAGSADHGVNKDPVGAAQAAPAAARPVAGRHGRWALR